MQANLIIAGGPHMKAMDSDDASGRFASHISFEIKPCFDFSLWWAKSERM